MREEEGACVMLKVVIVSYYISEKDSGLLCTMFDFVFSLL